MVLRYVCVYVVKLRKKTCSVLQWRSEGRGAESKVVAGGDARDVEAAAAAAAEAAGRTSTLTQFFVLSDRCM